MPYEFGMKIIKALNGKEQERIETLPASDGVEYRVPMALQGPSGPLDKATMRPANINKTPLDREIDDFEYGMSAASGVGGRYDHQEDALSSHQMTVTNCELTALSEADRDLYINRALLFTFNQMNKDCLSYRDGAVMSATVRVGNQLYTAGVGDTHVTLVDKEKAQALTVTHDAKNPNEVKRMAALGFSPDADNYFRVGDGKEYVGRAGLQPSRTIGDGGLKRGCISDLADKEANKEANKEAVLKAFTWVPDVTSTPLARDQFIIMTTDGAYPLLTDGDFQEMVSKFEGQNGTLAVQACASLHQKLKNMSESDYNFGMDNHTVMVKSCDVLLGMPDNVLDVGVIADGHGGVLSSQYIAANFARVFAEKLQLVLNDKINPETEITVDVSRSVIAGHDHEEMAIVNHNQRLGDRERFEASRAQVIDRINRFQSKGVFGAIKSFSFHRGYNEETNASHTRIMNTLKAKIPGCEYKEKMLSVLEDAIVQNIEETIVPFYEHYGKHKHMGRFQPMLIGMYQTVLRTFSVYDQNKVAQNLMQRINEKVPDEAMREAIKAQLESNLADIDFTASEYGSPTPGSSSSGPSPTSKSR